MKTGVKMIFTAVLMAAGAARADFVTIGHPGNAADSTGYGAVDYVYQIAKYEVSITDWDAFYDDPAGTKVSSFHRNYHLWNIGTGNPRRNVGPHAPSIRASFCQAAQYCNWLTTGDAARGAYTIDVRGEVTAIDRTFRNEQGLLYVIPTEDEWYKAAYFKPDGSGYSLYADGTDNEPSTEGWRYNKPDPLLPWPVNEGREEQNGTFNMMGNVDELVEDPSGTVRGGNFNHSAAELSSKSRDTSPEPTTESSTTGFRVVLISH